MDTCITIRTTIMRDGVAYLQAGAGIVADSDPTAEHQECLSKLAAMEAAIDLAERSCPDGLSGRAGSAPSTVCYKRCSRDS